MTHFRLPAVPADAAALGAQVSSQPFEHGAETFEMGAAPTSAVPARTAATGGRSDLRLLNQGAEIFKVEEQRT